MRIDRRVHHFTKRVSRAFALLGALSTSACATMVSGRSQQLPINVNPAGSTICIDGQKAGTSPMVVTLSRKRPHVIVVEHAGYQPVIRALAKEVNPWVTLNFVPFLLIPGPFGLAVDVATGAVSTFNTSAFDFHLEKDTTVKSATPTVECAPR
jgi:hypothetical protein